jgi:hypothetical protein
MKKLTVLLFGILVLSSGVSFSQYSTTPIMLSLPIDGDTIEEDEPLLVWQTTLSNLENDPRLNVSLSVVQVGEDQTPSEAILENSPVFMRQNLLSNSINYSEIDHELAAGKWYAWQVVLLYNGVQVQQSEVWKFIKASAFEMSGYYPLKSVEDASTIPLEGKVLYFTTREHGQFELTAQISGNGKKTFTVQLEEVFPGNEDGNTVSGGNENRYFKCDLSDLNLKKGTYKFLWNPNENTTFVHLIKKI